MKHRSVIAFVIVAAALFSLPQLSHDLHALKGAVGTALHRELLHAFLNLPAGEPTAAPAAAARPAEALLASCTKERSAAPAAKPAKAEASGRVEGRAEVEPAGQSAMIGDPASDPINQLAPAEVEGVETALADFKVGAEVAMIIPPDGGIDPRSLADRLTSLEVARVEADRLRAEAEGLRVAYAAAARPGANGPEWQKATEGAVRELNGALPGAYEFRVVRDGAKTKVLKFKCGDCPAGAPRPPRAPRHVVVDVPAPAPPVFESVSAGE
ncbi:MAG TPA: hypothetical protein VF586_02920 [Pyrinomonadaceae bacterium]|jgi:hypothetical protein